MAIVSSRGYRIAYDVVGAGPAVVLVCGFSQWADQWRDAGYVAALASRYRVVSIDPLGHGWSDKPHAAEAYSPDEVVRDLVAVTDAEGIEIATWWGFSRGAWMIQRLSVTDPDRVSAVILGSAVEGYGAGDWPDEPMADLLRSEGGLERIWAALGFTDPAEVTVALTRNDNEALACETEATGPPLEFERYSVPVLSYKGSRETYFEDDLAALRNSGAVLHEVAGAHHYAAFARSGEVLTFVEPFLDKVHA